MVEMRNRFDDLIKKMSQEFIEASSKIPRANIHQELKPGASKDELKKYYWEINEIRSNLTQVKSSVERRLAEIQSLTKNPNEIRKLLSTSSEGAMESIVRGTIEYNLNPASRNPIRWSIDARIDQAKRKLEGLYQSNKDLPSKFDAPIKEGYLRPVSLVV